MVSLKKAERAEKCRKICVHCWFALFDARELYAVAIIVYILKKYTV
jgi:hypothetical protein